jgi:glucose/arabinose dehydrogenase
LQHLLKTLKAYSSLFSLTTIILVAASLIISTSLTMSGSYYNFYHGALAVPHSLPPPSLVGPTIVNNETHLKIETVFTGLRSPTSMAFLGPNDILVLQKSQGTVQRIVNGNMLPKPLGTRLVKAFNTMYYETLRTGGCKSDLNGAVLNYYYYNSQMV